MQHRGCHGEHCRRTERHSWIISPHLARPCRSLREPARPTRAFRLAQYQPILLHMLETLGNKKKIKCKARTSSLSQSPVGPHSLDYSSSEEASIGTSLSSSIGASSLSLSSSRGRFKPWASPLTSVVGRAGSAPGGAPKIDFWRSVVTGAGAASTGATYVPRSLEMTFDDPLA